MKPTLVVTLIGAVTVISLLSMAFGYSMGASTPQAARMPTLAEYNASLPKDVYPDSRSRIPLIKRESLPPERHADYDERASANTTSLAGLQGPGGLRLNGSPEDRVGEALGGRLKELIRLIVSREMDQPFEWTVHEPVALREGLEPAIIDVVRLDKPLTGVPEREAAMIQLGREMFRTHKVSSATFVRAQKALGTRNLIDMAVLMGDYTETAILLTVTDVHLPYNRPSLLPERSAARTPAR
jgi:4-carboxymuconolactone decarboxylase